MTGILFNILATAAFDPFTATYDIRQGISEGNGGTDVSSGSATIAVAATGRNAFGLYEYTITATFSTVTLVPGEYSFTLEPQCINTLDGSCTVFRQFVSNTTQEANAVNGSWQPDGEMLFNSSFFGFTYANWCDSSLGLNSSQCDWLSFGLVGELQSKKLSAATMVVALTLTAAAAEKNRFRRRIRTTRSGAYSTGSRGLGRFCANPCLFYGGDLNPSAGAAEGFSDENALLVTENTG